VIVFNNSVGSVEAVPSLKYSKLGDNLETFAYVMRFMGYLEGLSGFEFSSFKEGKDSVFEGWKQ